MVCVPCFIIPVLLYIWHKFVQPFMLRYWNPWQKKDADGKVIKAGPEFPFQCKGGVCPFPGAKNESILNDGQANTDADTLTKSSTETLTAEESESKKQS